jgi:hypothetical protein
MHMQAAAVYVNQFAGRRIESLVKEGCNGLINIAAAGDTHNNDGRLEERPVAGYKEMDNTRQADNDGNSWKDYPGELVQDDAFGKGSKGVISHIRRHRRQ